MRRVPGFRIGRPARLILSTTAALTLMPAACDDPAQPPVEVADTWIHYDALAGTVVGRMDYSDDDFAPLDLVATEVAFDPETEHLHVWMSIRNSGTERTPAPDGVVVSCFVPRSVLPLNARGLMCQRIPPMECCSGWLFDHRGTFGGDYWLDPSETSTPVEWILRDPGGGSFSFAASPQVIDGATISGTVFEDRDADGRRDPDERGIDRASVSLYRDGMFWMGTRVDTSGLFRLRAMRTGVHRLRFSVHRDDIQDCEPTTPVERQVLVLRRADGSLADVDSLDYGCLPVPWPPFFTVGGVVYFDCDADGRRGPDELAFWNVMVRALEACGVVCVGHPQESVADAERGYRLALPAECCPTWSIAYDPITGYLPTTTPSVQIDSPAAGTEVTIDFGVSRTEPYADYTVRGFVYRDLDLDGVRDPGEPGMSGLDVSLSPVLCVVRSIRTATDATGAYEIAAHDIGCPLPWLVSHELPDSLWTTTPYPMWLEDAPPGGGTTYDVDFGVAAHDP